MSETVQSLKAANIAATHGFYMKKGGVSSGIYASLNCGAGSDDQLSNVINNRALVVEDLGPTVSDLLSAYQVHSNRVKVVDKIWTRERSPEVDGLVTRLPNIALGILTADCAPVLFHDPVQNVIGAAHAGWKGAIGGVLANTVKAMEEIGARRSDIHAAIGPCIHQVSYEVDANFRQTFVNQDPAFETFFTDGVRENHYQFDLPAFVMGQLEKLGLASVTPSVADTYEDEDSFFSFRRTTHREEKDYGRQISAIVLEG